MLTIRDINEENFAKVVGLQIDEQDKKFVASVEKSLAQCWLYRDDNDVFPFAVEVEGEIVGFILFEIDEEVLKIWRFLIDKKFQNKGYAKEVLKLVIEMAKADKTFYKILADYVNGNDKMKRLLMNMGFKERRYREDINEFETLYYIER